MYEDAHKDALMKLIKQAGQRYDVWSVFSDFCKMLSYAISNSVDLRQRDDREAAYKTIIQTYDKNTQALFPQMAGELTMALQNCVEHGEYHDVLGQVFHELDVNNKYKGQYFTPQSVSDMMAHVTIGSAKDIDRHIKEHGCYRIYEPACGSGSTILGFLNAYVKEKDAFPERLVVHAGDIDERCVEMCYIQLSLYGAAAIVEQRNALSMELLGGIWYTPMYIINGWEWRKPTAYHKAKEKELSQGCRKVVARLSQGCHKVVSQKESPPETEGEVEISLF